MGTTMTYIQLKNRGFTREELQGCMNALFGGEEAGKRPLKDLERGMEALTGRKLTLKDRVLLRFLHGVVEAETDRRPQVGFRADAGWLPLWQTWLCDGKVLSSADLGRLSEAFQTPVLAFALFDSDVLFVSYHDAAAGTVYDYARLPWEGYEEYDDEIYQTSFPEFLTQLCPLERREELGQIWEADGEDEVFADDRLWKLLKLMEMDVIDPEAERFPEGFEPVGPNA